MAERVIKVPDIGEGVAEVEVVEWRVKPGDTVAEDQIVADVMTDKASVEIPSPVSGRVVALGSDVGQMLAVGAPLIRIEVDGDEAPTAKAAPAAPAAAAAARAPAAPPRAAATAAPAQPAFEEPAPVQVEPSAPPPVPRRDAATADRPIASPSVRRRAWELGIDLKQVQARGPAGRIMHADLDAFAAARGTSVAAPSVVATAPATPAYAKRTDERKVPVIGLRRRIAMKMQESVRRIPHFTYVEEIDVTEVEALRGRLNAKFSTPRADGTPARPKLTLLPFVARAVVLALHDFPHLNARFDDEAGVVTRHGAVHLGIATQTPNGLMVPVLTHAETRDLWSLASGVARLAEAARSGRATRDELSGSTITITSLGALGGIVTTPVINHPEVAIVGVNRMVERPVWRNGAAVPRLTMNLSSSFDHRVVDGADAAEFIQAVRGLLETPALLFVE